MEKKAFTLPTEEMAKRHPDDERVDEIRIVTAPRYKTSGLSGDEWRAVARITLLRKGTVVIERSCHRIEDAAALLPWLLRTFGEEPDGNVAAFTEDEKCFQPGCQKSGLHKRYLVEEFSERGEGPLPRVGSFRLYRRFCDQHLTRGDGGREDANRNYTKE